MPAYDYVCSNCEASEQRIGGLDDHTVICDHCGQVMVRQGDLDTLLASYSQVQQKVDSLG
jgi:putative FmdB family regulatory protein